MGKWFFEYTYNGAGNNVLIRHVVLDATTEEAAIREAKEDWSVSQTIDKAWHPQVVYRIDLES